MLRRIKAKQVERFDSSLAHLIRASDSFAVRETFSESRRWRDGNSRDHGIQFHADPDNLDPDNLLTPITCR
jgi:hypothetical protein